MYILLESLNVSVFAFKAEHEERKLVGFNVLCHKINVQLSVGLLMKQNSLFMRVGEDSEITWPVLSTTMGRLVRKSSDGLCWLMIHLLVVVVICE